MGNIHSSCRTFLMGHLGCLELADEAVEALVEEKEKMKRRQEAFLG